MKKFLKHCNRGLLLALAVLLGLILYLKIDGIQFENAKPDIKSTITDYLAEVKKINLADAKEKISLSHSLLGHYWAAHGLTSGTYYGQEKESMESYLNSLATQGTLTQVTDYVDVIRDIQISKFGPGCAKATVTYDASLTLEEPDSDYLILGLQSDYYADYYTAATQSDSTQLSRSLTLTFYLQEVKEQWQIIGISTENAEE